MALLFFQLVKYDVTQAVEIGVQITFRIGLADFQHFLMALKGCHLRPKHEKQIR